MKLTVISVTYGDRFDLIEQVIDSLVSQGINDIWIVDNNSSLNSKEKLFRKSKEISNLKLFEFSDNLGSAGAYFEVLKHAFSFGEDRLFWFLDDDNLPLHGAVNALRIVFEEFLENGQTPVLYSYRGLSWEEDRKAVNEGYIKGPKPNSFCGFVFRDLFKSNMSLETKGLNTNAVNYPIVPVQWGPYGGLFTSLQNLKKIGLPNPEFFVYADDQDYTYRFYLNDIPQFLVYASQIKDIDESVGDEGGYFNENTSLSKLFYGLRNTTYLSKNMSIKPIEYFINKIVFVFILLGLGAKAFPKSPKLVISRLRWFFKALRNGEKGKLGKELSF